MARVVIDPAFVVRTAIAGAFVSILVSALHGWFDPLLNPDGVVYLMTAQAWLDDGYAAAITTFPMPLYSLLIALVHASTGLNLLTSARCLDATLIAILIIGVQRLAWALGGGPRVQFIAVVLALLLPELNGYRSFLIRDFGYWAFVVWALACLVRYAQAPDAKRAIAFFVLCLAAATFRLEAIPFLLLMPIALLFGQKTRASAAVALYVPPAIVFAAGAIIVLGLGLATNGYGFAAAARVVVALFTNLPLRIQSARDGFSSSVLDPDFTDFAGFGLAGGLATMVIVHVANAASLPVLAIACTGLWRRTLGTLRPAAAPLLWTAFIIVVLGLAAVLGSRGIIQTRYAMPAGLLILVIAAFVADDWYTRVRTPQERVRLRWVSALVLVYFLAEAGFALFNSKQHYLATAQWLEQNTAPGARIFSNDPRVVYLADRPVDWRDLNGAQQLRQNKVAIESFDYFAIYIAHDDEALRRFTETERRWVRVAEFTNRQGDGFVIYRSDGPTTPSGRD